MAITQTTTTSVIYSGKFNQIWRVDATRVSCGDVEKEIPANCGRRWKWQDNQRYRAIIHLCRTSARYYRKLLQHSLQTWSIYFWNGWSLSPPPLYIYICENETKQIVQLSLEPIFQWYSLEINNRNKNNCNLSPRATDDSSWCWGKHRLTPTMSSHTHKQKSDNHGDIFQKMVSLAQWTQQIIWQK